MPSVLIVVPPFPNVPQLPGVPQLVRSLSAPASSPPSIGTQATGALWAANNSAPTWGIYDQQFNSGVPIITPDSILDFDNKNEWKVSDYSVQANANGTGTGFAPYNKVTMPFENSVRMSKGGSLTDRTIFLEQIAAIAGDTNLYTIITPERSYTNVNIRTYEVTRRGASGAYFLCEVDVYFRQVPIVQGIYSSTTANTANARNPAALPAANQGQVQPIVPSAQLMQLATSKLGAS